MVSHECLINMDSKKTPTSIDQPQVQSLSKEMMPRNLHGHGQTSTAAKSTVRARLIGGFDPTTGLPMKGSAEVRRRKNIPLNHLTPSSPSSHNLLEVGLREEIDRSSVADALATFSEIEQYMALPTTIDYKRAVFSLPSPGFEPPTSNPSVPRDRQAFVFHPTAPENIPLLYRQDRLSRSLKLVSESKAKYGSQSTKLRLKAVFLERYIQSEIAKLERSLQAEWDRQAWVASEVGKNYVDMGKYCTKFSLYKIMH